MSETREGDALERLEKWLAGDADRPARYFDGGYKTHGLIEIALQSQRIPGHIVALGAARSLSEAIHLALDAAGAEEEKT